MLRRSLAGPYALGLYVAAGLFRRYCPRPAAIAMKQSKAHHDPNLESRCHSEAIR
jgi:hypothetical protein